MKTQVRLPEAAGTLKPVGSKYGGIFVHLGARLLGHMAHRRRFAAARIQASSPSDFDKGTLQ